MITKEKIFSSSKDRRIRAGEETEKDMAYHLSRRFAVEPDVHVINDLRIEHKGFCFQIDHLVVTRWGLFIVESKSVHGVVSIKAWDDKREHWTRSFDNSTEGIDSPILQAEEQARLLREFLRDNATKLLGKMIGFVQRGFAYCPIESLVAISRTGVIEVDSGSLPSQVFKADEIAPEIARRIGKKSGLLKQALSVDWDMPAEDAARVAAFLVAAHTPARRGVQVSAPTEEALADAPSATKRQDVTASETPRAGSLCPKCGKRKLIRKSVKRHDGTETDFLACEGYPAECAQMLVLVAQTQAGIVTLGGEDSSPGDCDFTGRSREPKESPHNRRIEEQGKNSFYCFQCGADIQKNVAAFCFDRPQRFGGRAFCLKCQKKGSVRIGC